MNDKLILYIEGTSDDTNGDLRQGFHDLFVQKLKGKMPKIKMTDGQSQAISAFKKPIPGHDPLLVIDLDSHESLKDEVLNKNGLYHEKAKVYFMVQEMEAWFLSQPKILDNFYHSNISSKIKRPPSEIPDPSDELLRITKNMEKKQPYHKVRHGVELLGMLHLDQLMNDFIDVKNLIERLSLSTP